MRKAAWRIALASALKNGVTERMRQFPLAFQPPRCDGKRRLAGLLAGAAVAWLGVCLVHAQSSSTPYEEGTHYERLPVPVETQAPDGVEVVEVFSYACYHCYSFQPLVEPWSGALADDVKFRRTPAVFSDLWRQLARLFYAAQSLGVLEAVHQPIFEAIHQRGRDLTQTAIAAELFEEAAGVDEKTFQDALNSFTVETRVQQSVAAGKAYRVTGTPTLIVNGKFRIDSRMADGHAGMLQVADFLIAAERAEAAADE